jgi:hypothetical protein
VGALAVTPWQAAVLSALSAQTRRA